MMTVIRLMKKKVAAMMIDIHYLFMLGMCNTVNVGVVKFVIARSYMYIEDVVFIFHR